MHPEQVDQMLDVMHESAARFTCRDVVRDLDQTLREVVDGAVTAIPGVTDAGITVLESEGRLTSTAPTGEVVARLDQAQAALREGPCVAVLATHNDPAPPSADSNGTEPADTEPAGTGPTGAGRGANGDRPGDAELMVLVDDMTAESHDGGRWPRFAPEALRNGIVSMLSLHLSGDRHPMRALNLYAEQPAVFDTAACAIAALFADQAAIALYGAEHAAGLNHAVATRDIIGQAKGILLERHHLASSDDAFRMLVEASQHTNLKLRDVAEWLVTNTVTNAASTSSSDR